MKTTILLFILIVGSVAPAYSQVKHRYQIDARTEQFNSKKKFDFGDYKFAEKFTGGNFKLIESFNTFSITPMPRIIYSGDNMPCFHPKDNYYIPCYKPQDEFFNMRVYKPESVIWGILW